MLHNTVLWDDMSVSSKINVLNPNNSSSWNNFFIYFKSFFRHLYWCPYLHAVCCPLVSNYFVLLNMWIPWAEPVSPKILMGRCLVGLNNRLNSQTLGFPPCTRCFWIPAHDQPAGWTFSTPPTARVDNHSADDSLNYSRSQIAVWWYRESV